MLKAVLFDLDNTLIDFMRMKRSSVDAAIDGMIGAGLKLSKEQATKKFYDVYSEHGIEHQQVIQKFLRKINGKIDYKILAAGIVAYRKAQTGLLMPYAQVIPTLIKLRENGMKLAIISDAPRLKAWMRLVELGIQDFFDVVITFDDTKTLKPAKAPFQAALKKLKLKADECLMVGDWPERDIKGATNMGMHTALAKYGLTKPVVSKANYDLDSIEEVLKVVEAIK